VSADNCFSEDRHKHCICSVRSRKFHVVGELVGRDALQYEMAGISVLALVALKRNSQEANPDCEYETKNDYRHSPPCKPHEPVVDVGLTHHGSSYLDEKQNVATEGDARNCGSPTDSRRVSELQLGDSAALYLHDCDRLRLGYARNREADFFFARSRVGFRCRPGGRDDFCIPACLAWRISV